MKTFVIEKIKWETDGYKVDLPTVLSVECESEEEIADTISDRTGWLVESFSIVRI